MSAASFREWAYSPYGKPKATWEITRAQAYELFEQYENERRRADRNQEHLDVERSANAKTIAGLQEQYAELEKAAAVLVAQPFGSLDQRAFYRLREVLGA